MYIEVFRTIRKQVQSVRGVEGGIKEGLRRGGKRVGVKRVELKGGFKGGGFKRGELKGGGGNNLNIERNFTKLQMFWHFSGISFLFKVLNFLYLTTL